MARVAEGDLLEGECVGSRTRLYLEHVTCEGLPYGTWEAAREIGEPVDVEISRENSVHDSQ